MNKINFMRQIDGINLVEITYKSGVSRNAGLCGSYYKFTKTQLNFMDNARVFDLPCGTRYWVNENTDTVVMDYIQRNNGTERR